MLQPKIEEEFTGDEKYPSPPTPESALSDLLGFYKTRKGLQIELVEGKEMVKDLVAELKVLDLKIAQTIERLEAFEAKGNVISLS